MFAPTKPAALLLAVGLALATTGCDLPWSSEEAPPSTAPSATPTPTPTPTPEPPVELTLRIEHISGVAESRLPAFAPTFVSALTPVLTTYVDQSFRSEGPTAYDSFTAGAAAVAQAQAQVTTRAGFGDVEQIRATRLDAAAEVFAPGGEPAGAKVWINFGFDLDGREASVTGHLLLSPEADGWRIFGFDLKQTAPDPVGLETATPDPAEATGGGQ